MHSVDMDQQFRSEWINLTRLLILQYAYWSWNHKIVCQSHKTFLTLEPMFKWNSLRTDLLSLLIWMIDWFLEFLSEQCWMISLLNMGTIDPTRSIPNKEWKLNKGMQRILNIVHLSSARMNPADLFIRTDWLTVSVIQSIPSDLTSL